MEESEEVTKRGRERWEGGFQSNNWSSNHRIMQIARKEVSQELRLIRATFPVIMSRVFGPA